MTVESRLKARKLQIGNTLIVSLSICIAFMIVVILNLTPLIYEKLVVSAFNNKFLSLTVSAVIVFLVYSVYTAIKLGVCRFFFKRASKFDAGTKDIFYYFRLKRLLPSLIFSVRISALKLLCFLFCYFPAAITLGLFLKLTGNKLSLAVAVALLCGTLMFVINGTVFYSNLISSLFLCNYYFVSGQYLNFRHLVSCSQNAMNKNKNKLLTLRVSFTGWFLSCVFLLPLFYVFCYYKQSMAVLAYDIIDK